MLRPSQLDDPDLGRLLAQDALFGPARLFEMSEGTTPRLVGDRLVIRQSNAWLAVDAEGTVTAVRPLYHATSGMGMNAVVDEDIADDLAQMIRLADGVLRRIDPTQRLTAVAPVAALLATTHGGWRTRAEQAASPTSMTLNLDATRGAVARLTPPTRPRAALQYQAAELADDLRVLLRRATVR